MLKLITGDDQTSISNFLKSIKSGYSANSLHEFSGSDFSVSDIIDSTQTTSMFSEKTLVIVIPNKAEQADFSEEFLRNLKTNKDVEVVINAAKLNKLTNVYKLIAKYADQKNDFSLKKDYSNFDVADLLFVYGNKKMAITKVNQMTDLDTEFMLLLSAIYSGLRNKASIDLKNETAAKLPSFIKNKYLKSASVKIDYPTQYKNLLELDVSLKSMPGDRKSRIIDYMLYSV